MKYNAIKSASERDAATVIAFFRGLITREDDAINTGFIFRLEHHGKLFPLLIECLKRRHLSRYNISVLCGTRHGFRMMVITTFIFNDLEVLYHDA